MSAINVTFLPSSVSPAVQSDSAVIFCVGAAPVVQIDVLEKNRPVLCNTLGEFNDAFGQADPDDWDDYPLVEAAQALFSLYARAPFIGCNVIDTLDATHIDTAVSEPQTMAGPTDAEFVTADELNVVLSTLVITDAATGLVTYVLDTDYTVAFSSTVYGSLVISRITAAAGGSIGAAEALLLDYDFLDPSGVLADDIIGSVSGSTYKGWEVVNQVYPQLRKVPSILTCPVWSETSSVAAVMVAKAASINGMFKALALTDLPSDKATIATYAAVPAYTQTEGYTSKHQLNGWPLFVVDSNVYHASSHMAAILSRTDGAAQIPFNSPHNKDVAAGTSIQHVDGTVLTLEPSQADVVKDGGCYTMLKWTGIAMWGTHTGAYPGSTDVTEASIVVTRMQWWYNNAVILRNWAKLGDPINRRTAQSVVDTEQQILNGLIAQGALLPGATITFPADLNSDTDLLAGSATFLVTWTIPITLEEINFQVQYDAAGLAGLF